MDLGKGMIKSPFHSHRGRFAIAEDSVSNLFKFARHNLNHTIHSNFGHSVDISEHEDIQLICARAEASLRRNPCFVYITHHLSPFIDI